MSDPQRKALYAVAAAVLAALGAFGIVTAAQADQWLQLADSILTLASAVVPLVARRHITPQE